MLGKGEMYILNKRKMSLFYFVQHYLEKNNFPKFFENSQNNVGGNTFQKMKFFDIIIYIFSSLFGINGESLCLLSTESRILLL